ncbi:MAG: hypothetical protein GX072_11030 [Lysinibacillus sp.]|nr:hypothetical protein [Lysinibacillus sp.]
MAQCPLCNSLTELEVFCPKCENRLDDSGKVSDYLEPYAHYEAAETVKMGDVYPNTAREQLCPHLMVCQQCGYDEVHFIKEV